MRTIWMLCIGAFVTLAPVANAAPEIDTGQDLVAVCEPYAKLDERAASNAAAASKCQQFLVNFFTAYGEVEKVKLDTAVSIMPGGPPSPCVRLPEQLSYREMAGRLVAMARNDPTLLKGPAVTLVQRTLEHDFPCPEGAKEPGR